jgi:hypothetical protein
MKKILLLILFICINLTFAIEFYSGSTYISSLSTTIEITNEKAFVISNYVFKGDDKVKVNFVGLPPNAVVEFDGKTYSKEFSINPEGEKTVKVTYEFDLGDEDTQGLKYSPKPTFDDKLYSEKVNHYLKVIAPYYLNGFTSVSRDYTSSSKENGKNIFIWDEHAYLKPLVLKWNTLNFDISVTREIPNILDDVFEVKITITNNGNKDIENLMLEENFMRSHFEGVYPKEEFKLESYGIDTRLYWRKIIPLLKSGETKTVSYKLKPLKLTEQNIFNPLLVKYNNIIIASTEKQIYYDDDVQSSSKVSPEILPSTIPPEEVAPGWVMTPEEMEKRRIMEEEGLTEKEFEEKYGKINLIEKIRSNIIYILIIIALIIIAIIVFKFFGKKGGKIETYIEENLKKGYSKQHIRAALLKANWPKDKVDKALNRVK